MTALVASGVVVVLVLGAVVWSVWIDSGDPVAAVVALYPKADSSRVAADITPRITQALAGIAGLSVLGADSRDGVAIVSLGRKDGHGLTQADRLAIQAALKAAKPALPRGLPTPILDADGKRRIIVVAVTRPHSMGPADPRTLAAAARRLQRRLEVVAGMDRVVVEGIRDRHLVVRIEPNIADRYKINPKAVASALSRAVPASRPLTTPGELAFSLPPNQLDADSIGSIPIAVGAGGSIVPLRSIATVELALTGSDDDWVRIDETLAVVLVARPIEGATGDGWAEDVRRVIRDFGKEGPRVVAVITLYPPPS